MSTLPKAVQRQLEEAEALQRQAAEQYARENGLLPPEADPQPVPDSPQPQAVVEPVPAPAPDKDSDPNGETWKQRYRTLQGIIETRSRQFQQEQQQLRAEIAELTEKVNKSRQVQVEPEAPLITAKDEQEFGPEMLNLIERKAKDMLRAERAAAAEYAEQLRNEVAELKKQVGYVSESQTIHVKNRFYADLTKEVPDWEQLNVEDDFLMWLDQVDDLLGVTRQEYLNKVHGDLDVRRTAALFKAYKATKPAPESTPPRELQSQVSPSRSSAAPAPTQDPQRQRVWRGAEIQQVHDMVRRKRIVGEEAKRIMLEVDTAIAEGRVVP